MKRLFHRFVRKSDATAAVEAAIFAPLFLMMMLGVTDLGAGMFVKMTANAAAQAGAAYAAFNITSACTTLSACFSGIKTAMNGAAGDSSFCTGSVCTASMSPSTCTAGSVCVITVSVNYPYKPILSDAVYTWGKAQTYSTTVTIRIQ
jgi:Flp pilus assembly protein TadG